jgi:hypothetical protein
VKALAHALLAALFVLLAAAPSARADHTSGHIIFEAIDSVEVEYDRNLRLRGLLQGETQVVEELLNFHDAGTTQSCHKQVLLMLERPGRYLLEVTVSSNDKCALKRR